MKVPNFDIKGKYNRIASSVRDGFSKNIKPVIAKGLNYTKNLSKDTLEFVKTKPKKAGLVLATAGMVVSVAAIISKLFKTNSYLKELTSLQFEHIDNQAEVIDGLKEDIEARKVAMAALHDAVEAAHSHIQKLAQNKDA